MKQFQTTDSGEIVSWHRQVLPAFVIVAVTLAAYLPARRAGFIWDDDDYVTNNAALKAPDGLRRIWLETRGTPQYYPLVFTVLRLEYGLWGLQPVGYHTVNILLQAAAALLLWRLLSRLGLPGAWWAAIIFAVHPVQVESVVWVTELKNVLSGFFYIAALGAALRFYLPENPAAESGERHWAAYGAAFLLFGCALLSKTVTCSLPVAVLLILWWKRGRFSRLDVATLLPFFVLGAAMGLNTARLELSHVGAVGPEWNLSFLERILIGGRALWFYAGKLVWPARLTFIYPRWEVNAAAPWQYLFPLAALAALAVLWRLRGRIGRGPLAATLFFALTLAPALGFFNLAPMRYSFVADHFQYLACIGLIALAVGGMASRLTKGGQAWRGIPKRSAMILCGAAAVAAFSALSWNRCHAYRDAETLWRDTLAKNPDAWMAHNNLAVVLLMKEGPKGSLASRAVFREDALLHLTAAIGLKKDYSAAYNNRGNVYLATGRVEEAIRDFDTAIRLNPHFAEAYFNRGNARIATDFDAAVEDYTEAIRSNPDYASPYQNRAVMYYYMKEYEKAAADVATLQKLGGQADPDFLKELDRARGLAK